jgi:hypothetical protein
LFVGTIEDLERWLQGLHFARRYDTMIMGKNFDAQRDRKEQDYRNKSLLRSLKGESEKENQ